MAVRERQTKQHEELRDAIKATARALMTEHGTAGLSIRAVARALDLTPAALYYYFPGLDDIITALIVDGYNALADALSTHGELSAGEVLPGTAAHLLHIADRYRAWALQHPTDFQLLFGNPIPGYHAPRAVTVPAVVRTFSAVVGACEAALQSGALDLPDSEQAVPPTILAHIREQIERENYPVRPQALYLGTSLVAAMHGCVMLELMQHLQPTVGDPDAFFREQMRGWLRSVGGLPAP